MENKEFDKILKSKLQGFESKPPEGTFAAIQSKMNAPANDTKAVGFIWPPMLKYGLAASLAFVLGLATMNWYGNQNENNTVLAADDKSEVITITTNEEIKNLASSQENTTTISNELTIEEEIENEALEMTSLTAETNTENTAKEEVLVASNNSFSVEEGFNTNSKVNIVINPNARNEASNQELEIFTESENKVTINVAGVYAANEQKKEENLKVYALYGLENALEEEKIEMAKIEKEPHVPRFENNNSALGYTGFWFGPKLNGNHQTIAGQNIFGLGLGFDLGYDFKPNFGIQSGFSYNMMIKDLETFNEQGQEQHELLDYSRLDIPFSLKWKKSYFADNIKRPVSFNAYVGGDYARLTKLNKNQLGAHIGLEYDLFLKPEMMFTLGLRSGFYNILDYTPTEENLQANYKKFNYAMSIYTSLRFISPKKRK